MKTTNRVRKVPIKTAGKTFSQAPHTNFAEEIYQQQKTDKFLDRAFAITSIICVVLFIAFLIVNIK